MTAPTARLEVRLESSEFPCEHLHILRVSGVEGISRLFRFEIVVTCLESEALDWTGAQGAAATVVFTLNGIDERRVNGMIAQVTHTLEHDVRASYTLVLAPRAHRLTLVETQEVYIDASIPDIIKKKAEAVRLDKELDLRFTGTYATREFVVQYKESDLAFLGRLTEHLGISFFFEHVDGLDRWVFTDQTGGFTPSDTARPLVLRAQSQEHTVHRIDFTQRVMPSVFMISDYNYETPLVDLTGVCNVDEAYGGGVIEWGAHYKAPADALVFAQIRAEERTAQSTFLVGESNGWSLAAGARVVLQDHPALGTVELLIVEITHELHQAPFGADASNIENVYKNRFRAVPVVPTYRPPRTTPRARIHGVTSGIIEPPVGVQTEAAWIDSQGRYTVRILFDTAATGERKASLPIRMAQPHSGPNYGIHFPLRPGAEVLIAFVEGDPDRPLIVGSVPNALTPTPVNQSEATMHRMRTWSGVSVEIDDDG